MRENVETQRPYINLRNRFFGSLTIQSDQLAFDTMTAYLKPQDKIELELKLQAIEVDQTLAEKINLGDWVSLFNECNVELFPLHALRCFKDGCISDMAFSTSQLFFTVWTAEDNCKENNIQKCVISVFDNCKNRVQFAEEMIDSTMKLASSSYKKWLEVWFENLNNTGVIIPFHPRLNKIVLKECIQALEQANEEKTWDAAQKNQFYTNLLQLPPSEHAFLLVRDSLVEDIERKQFSILDAINFVLGFNALSRLDVDQQPMRIIPSRGMMQAYLEAIHPSSTPKPIYRFGISTIRGLHNTLKGNGRDLFQSFKCLRQYTPKIVDGHPASTRYVEAELHDFYHQMRIAQIPLDERNMFIALADCLLAFANSTPVCNKFARKLALQIIEMEHGAYESNLENNSKIYTNLLNLGWVDPSYRFWHSLDISAGVTLFLLDKFLGDKELESTLEALKEWVLNDNIENKEYHQTLLSSIKSYKESNPPSPMSNNLRFSIQLQTKIQSNSLNKGCG